MATCSSPVTVLESEIEQSVPPVGYSHDPSVQEGSIIEQADAVEKQWKWIVEVLKQRLDQCKELMKKLESFEEKYQNNLMFIEQGEELIRKYHSLDHDSSSITDPVMFATQREKCQVSRVWCVGILTWTPLIVKCPGILSGLISKVSCIYVIPVAYELLKEHATYIPSRYYHSPNPLIISFNILPC